MAGKSIGFDFEDMLPGGAGRRSLSKAGNGTIIQDLTMKHVDATSHRMGFKHLIWCFCKMFFWIYL
jgi:hypothetical protein